MLPKKYHAIIFICILAMLLLLGLHLLGFGYGGGGGGQTVEAANSAALARNSSQVSSSSSTSSIVNAAFNPNQVYRHPIIYDKLTGATNNQINDVLGGKLQANDYPLDHYQQQAQSPLNPHNAFQQVQRDDPFFNIHRQSAGFPHPLHHPNLAPPPPPPPPHLPPPQMLTTRAPMDPHHPQPQQTRPPMLLAAPPGPNNQPMDSLPLASSGARPAAAAAPLNATQQLPPFNHQQQQPQPQPHQLYYTPPIFAYNNNFEQPLGYLQANQQPQTQQPPLGVPEMPMSIDEYNARQARLRQINQPIHSSPPNENADLNQQLNQPATINGQPNLLADPQQQQRHKDQMLDRQALLANPASSSGYTALIDNPNQTSYYPADLALYRNQPSAGMRPPYAQLMPRPTSNEIPGLASQWPKAPPLPQTQFKPQNNNRIDANFNGRLPEPKQNATLGIPSSAMSSNKPMQSSSHLNIVPACVRQAMRGSPSQASGGGLSLESANSTSQMPVLLCEDDSEYPAADIMRAVEIFAATRSIEELLPQSLVQIQLSNQKASTDNLSIAKYQVTLDPLQASLASGSQPDEPPKGDHSQFVSFDEQTGSAKSSGGEPLFPSTKYDAMCKSSARMTQPRRAKNLLGQWKVIVNLPGHKYRGVAISQMVRVDECSRPNSECSSPGGSTTLNARSLSSFMSKSRCLQQYENQRLVAWSHQRGLHVDIFRIPISCSCHIRR